MKKGAVKLVMYLNYFVFAILLNSVGIVILKSQANYGVDELQASILEAYCICERGEVFIRNMHVTEYENGSFYNHKPRADRKLLLNKKEIKAFEKFLQVKGNTLIPLKLFLSEKGWVKLEIATAQGKKLHDKRQDLKEKDDKRDMARAMKR